MFFFFLSYVRKKAYTDLFLFVYNLYTFLFYFCMKDGLIMIMINNA